MNKEQRLVLAISILGSLVAFLDGSIVNVALPAMSRALGGGLAVQQWVVDSYLLTLGAFILIAGSLSDLMGRKRILKLGLIGFGVFSLLCALAPSGISLVIFRAFQGIAGALLVPSSLALIISTFSGAAQGKAIGTWTAWTGIAFIIGPLLGGFLVDEFNWRWIFGINLLPIAVTLYLLSQLKDEGLNRSKKVSVDVFGAALCVTGLGGPVFAFIEQSRYGWSSPIVYLPLVLGLGILMLFIFYEKSSKKAMLPLSIFKHRNFSVGNVATLAVYAGLGASTFLITIFLQQVVGYSALRAGLALLPVTVLMFFLSPRAGKLSSRYGARTFMALGPIIGAAGFLLMTNMNARPDYLTNILPGVIVFGLGLSITVAPLTSAILGDVDSQQAGIASAVNNAVARVAGLLAVAAIGAVISSQFVYSLKENKQFSDAAIKSMSSAPFKDTLPAGYGNEEVNKAAVTQASVSGFHAGLYMVSGLLFAGGLVSAAGIRNKRQPADDIISP